MFFLSVWEWRLWGTRTFKRRGVLIFGVPWEVGRGRSRGIRMEKTLSGLGNTQLLFEDETSGYFRISNETLPTAMCG